MPSSLLRLKQEGRSNATHRRTFPFAASHAFSRCSDTARVALPPGGKSRGSRQAAQLVEVVRSARIGNNDRDRGRCTGRAVRDELSFAECPPVGQRSGCGRCRPGRDRCRAGLQLILELPRRDASGLLPATDLDRVIGQRRRKRLLAGRPRRVPQPHPGRSVGCAARGAGCDLLRPRRCGDRIIPIAGRPTAGQPRQFGHRRRWDR